MRILQEGVIPGYRDIELHADLFSGNRAPALSEEVVLGQVQRGGLRKPKRPRVTGMVGQGTEAVEH